MNRNYEEQIVLAEGVMDEAQDALDEAREALIRYDDDDGISLENEEACIENVENSIGILEIVKKMMLYARKISDDSEAKPKLSEDF
jgi:hypothetical protein